MKRAKRHKIKKEMAETSTSHSKELQEHDLAYYIHDRVELMHQVFSVIKYKELKAMAPACVRNISIDDLQELCTEELLGISSKRLCAILDGGEAPSDTESSSASPTPELETISLDSISSDEEILSQSGSKKKKHKHRRHSRSKSKRKKSKDGSEESVSNDNQSKATRAGLTVLELLELQARARAIRAQLQQEQKNKVPASEIVEHVAESSAHSSDNEVEIKEEPAEVVEISSEDEKPKIEDLEKDTYAQKELTSQPASTTVTKRIKDLVITVPQKSKQKIKLNRTKNVSTPDKTTTTADKNTKTTDKSNTNSNTIKDNAEKTTKVLDKDQTTKEKPKKKKKKKSRLTTDNDGSDNDEITLQLSDSEKMDLLEDLDRKNLDCVSSDSASSSDSESDSETDSDTSEKITDNAKKVEKLKTNKNSSDSSRVSKRPEKSSKSSKRVSPEKVTKMDQKVADDSENGIRSPEKSTTTLQDKVENSNVTVQVHESPKIVINSPDKVDIDPEIATESIDKVTENVNVQRSPENVAKCPKIITDTPEISNKSPEKDTEGPEIVIEGPETSSNNTAEESISNHSENDRNEVSMGTQNVILKLREEEMEMVSNNTKEVENGDKNTKTDENKVAIITTDVPQDTIKEVDSQKDTEKAMSEGELSDRESSELEAVELKPEVVCISDEDENKSKKKKKKKDKKSKKEKKSKKKSDFRESADQNFYKDREIIENKNEPTKTVCVNINNAGEDIDYHISNEQSNKSVKMNNISITITNTNVSHSTKDNDSSDNDIRISKDADKNIDKVNHKNSTNSNQVIDKINLTNEIADSVGSNNVKINIDNKDLTTTIDKKSPESTTDDDVYEILELSDDSSCYEVEGTTLSKEPTTLEIEALSAKIDEINREEVITEEEIREYERSQENLPEEGDVENISWKDRYLDSNKVKRVLNTSNILNALRKKNKELKKKLEESRKEATKVEEEESIQEEDVTIETTVQEGSIDHYNTLQGSNKYVSPAKDDAIPETSELSNPLVSGNLKKDAKLLLKMYKRLLKYNDINKQKDKDPNRKKKKKKNKKDLEKSTA